MGASRWSPTDWDHYTATTTAGKRTAEIFTSHSMAGGLNPLGVDMRESRDSDINPESNAIIVGLDVTGSMGMIADALARTGLGTLVEEIIKRKPVSDPHVMMMGIGDAWFDRSPLQVTQFEADIRIADQLAKLYLEHGGGGNSVESYNLPWYFAAMHTSIDCFEKRGRKGYLFTVGDEEPPEVLLKEHVERIIGDTIERDLSSRELLTMVERSYHVFHVVVEEGSHVRHSGLGNVMAKWTDLLGQRVLRLSDHRKLAEVVVSAIEVNEGRDSAAVAGSWSGDTSLVVARAVGGLAPTDNNSGGLVRFS